MKILVTGGHGQLGRSLVRRAGAHEVIALDADQLDITEGSAIARSIDELRPEAVINAAAYTAVDKAEQEPERAFAINRDGAGLLARASRDAGIPFLHVSTDYVFAGDATTPYTEDAPLAPTGVYGASKAAGEELVRAAGGTVVRTSWLFAAKGPSFVHTMVRLATERAVLRVVGDQHGCPTWAEDLALALFALAERDARANTYHFCGSEPTTWHAFATAIVDEARRYRTLACERIEAITTAEYPTPAQRPAYSVLDTSRAQAAGLAVPSWRPGLASVIAEDFKRS